MAVVEVRIMGMRMPDALVPVDMGMPDRPQAFRVRVGVVEILMGMEMDVF